MGATTLALSSNRDSGNRGDTYPTPLWLFAKANFTNGDYPSFDCNNTGAPGNGTEPANTTPEVGHEACWVAPTLPGAQPGQIPRLVAANYK